MDSNCLAPAVKPLEGTGTEENASSPRTTEIHIKANHQYIVLLVGDLGSGKS